MRVRMGMGIRVGARIQAEIIQAVFQATGVAGLPRLAHVARLMSAQR